MKPNDISDDAWEAARERVVAIRVFTGEEAMIEIVARAIMAERERCVSKAKTEKYPAYPASLTSDEMAPFQSGADAMRENIATAIRGEGN